VIGLGSNLYDETNIIPITSKYRTFVDSHIAKNWAGPFVVSRRALHDTRTQQGFVAVTSGEVVGYVLYNIAHGECEITVLESLRPKQGIGHVLVDAIIRVAKEMELSRVWLITTNDNTPAIRFYQRCEFTLKAVHINSMEESRKLKPQIPLIGLNGIPLVHEIEFEIREVTT